jgi:hypothetical protein
LALSFQNFNHQPVALTVAKGRNARPKIWAPTEQTCGNEDVSFLVYAGDLKGYGVLFDDLQLEKHGVGKRIGGVGFTLPYRSVLSACIK